MVASTTTVLCSSCGARLARDNTATICSPCRRTLIENAAHLGALSDRDTAAVKAAFDCLGLNGMSHVAAATALNISRWTIATYRRQLGTERSLDALTSPI